MNTKVAIVTGGGKRLGKEIAICLAKNGFNIGISFLKSEKEANNTAEQINNDIGSAIAIKADVRKRKDIISLFKKINKIYGRIDVLINNAAIFEKTDFNSISESSWDNCIDTNLKSCFLCSVEASQYMKKQKSGKIINISSLGGIKPYKNYLPYSVSKAGVIMLTKCLAKELAPDILVNCIAPGIISFSDDIVQKKSIPDTKKIPLKIYGKPKDITDAVTFFVNSSDYITGQTMIIDGGRILN